MRYAAITVLLCALLLVSCDVVKEYKYRYSEDWAGWTAHCESAFIRCKTGCGKGAYELCTRECRDDHLACDARRDMAQGASP